MALRLLALLLLLSAQAPASESEEPVSALDTCVQQLGLPRVARVLDPNGQVVYARVTDAYHGVPLSFVTIGPGDLPLAQVFEQAERDGAEWTVLLREIETRICAPVRISQSEIDDGRRIVVAAGLNYSAHADEAGGGRPFVFPKPAAPTPPFGQVTPPAGVTLLDYEVELAFVLFDRVDLNALPSRKDLLARSAFLVANDVSDREPIIAQAGLFGPGRGYVEGKGQPTFLPIGPWMMRGTDLFGAMAACGADGLRIRLAVNEQSAFRARQDSNTALLRLDPLALLEHISRRVKAKGLRPNMRVQRGDQRRRYPIAADEVAPYLPAGSLVLTGTPGGVALQAPNPLALLARGLLRLRGPFEQLRREELERARTRAWGGYLEAGDRVRASIDGLGEQTVRIAPAGEPLPDDPC